MTIERKRIPTDKLFMPPEFWGVDAKVPAVPDDGWMTISDRPIWGPEGNQYAVTAMDPDTERRYWATRPAGEKEQLTLAEIKNKSSGRYS
jgi:hypothetical protein